VDAAKAVEDGWTKKKGQQEMAVAAGDARTIEGVEKRTLRLRSVSTHVSPTLPTASQFQFGRVVRKCVGLRAADIISPTPYTRTTAEALEAYKAFAAWDETRHGPHIINNVGHWKPLCQFESHLGQLVCVEDTKARRR